MVYNNTKKILRRKSIMTMEEFWAAFDEFFTKLWNWLYDLICGKLDEEVNEDFYVDTMFPDAE